MLFQTIKEELLQAKLANADGSFDYKVLCSLPILQSVYVECLRLHVGILITRKSTDPVTMSGYSFPKGSIFQAPTDAAHLDEAVCKCCLFQVPVAVCVASSLRFLPEGQTMDS